MKSVFVIKGTFFIAEITGILGKVVKSQTNFANRILRKVTVMLSFTSWEVGHGVSNLVPEMDTLKICQRRNKDSLSSETFQLSPVTIHSYFTQEDSLCHFSLLP